MLNVKEIRLKIFSPTTKKKNKKKIKNCQNVNKVNVSFFFFLVVVVAFYSRLKSTRDPISKSTLCSM